MDINISKVFDVLNLLKDLNDNERLEVFSYFCTKCGATKLKCACGWH